MSRPRDAVEERFRKMILNLTPGERVTMACRMFSTGVALVRAGLRACGDEDTLAGDRQRVFMRLYGRDFSPSERAGILRSLAQDSSSEVQTTRNAHDRPVS